MKNFLPSDLRAGTANNIAPMMRAIVGLGRNDGDIVATMKQMFPGDPRALEMATKGTTLPFGVGTTAAALQSTALSDIVSIVGAKASVLGYLITHGAIPIKFKNSVSSETVLSVTTTGTAKVVEPGEPIPNVQAIIDGVDVVPRKVAFITTMTSEAVAGPNAETLIPLALKENIKLSGEGLLLATAGDGLRFGTVAITAAPAGATAMTDDLANLGAAVSVAAGDLSNIIFIADPVSALRISIALPLLKIPVLASAALLPNEVCAVAVNCMAIGGGDEIRIEVSDQAAYQMSDTPDPAGIAGASPVRSLWQTDCKSIRLILDMGWAMRSPNAIAWAVVNW